MSNQPIPGSESERDVSGAGQVKPAARRKARRFALQAMYQWHISKTPVNDLVAQFRVDFDMRKADVGYFSELVKQAVTRVDELDELIAPCLDRPIHEMDPVELNVLRLSAYELFHRIDVPYRVVINEGIELAKVFGATDGFRYVNGVLDKLAAKARVAERKNKDSNE